MEPEEVLAIEQAWNLPMAGDITNVSHSHNVSPAEKLAHVEQIIRQTVRDVDHIYEPYRTYTRAMVADAPAGLIAEGQPITDNDHLRQLREDYDWGYHMMHVDNAVAKGLARIDNYLGLKTSWYKQPQMPQRPYSQHEGAIQAFLGGGFAHEDVPGGGGGQGGLLKYLPNDVMRLIGEQHGSENMAIRRDSQSLATMAQISHPEWDDMRARNYKLVPRYQTSWPMEPPPGGDPAAYGT